MEEKDTWWGTWEELVLCAAILRHGHHDWKIVTAELRSRTISPLNTIFTPELCKAKYEELTLQYPLRKVWYDELRKKRIMELKRALEESDDSIGSLKSKLETLTADRDGSTDDSTRCEPEKDTFSAGSFTQDAQPVSPPQLDAVFGGFSKGPRGPRKRKTVAAENCGSSCSSSETDDVMSVFNSIAQERCASVFRSRLDSQKRGRYKRMIIRHLDFDAIRSKIVCGTIKSFKEVYRDLLLLANNALVYYSKNTMEYRSALLLRDIVSRRLTKHLAAYISKNTIALQSSSCPQKIEGASTNVAGNAAFKGEKRVRFDNPSTLGSIPAPSKEPPPGRRGRVIPRTKKINNNYKVRDNV